MVCIVHSPVVLYPHSSCPPDASLHANVNNSQPNARFSTYSGAPSLQPSLAPTMETVSHRSSSTQPYGSRRPSGQAFVSYDTMNAEKPSTDASAIYRNAAASARGSSLTIYAASDPRAADLKCFASVLDKMAEPRLDRQRYVMSGHKIEEISKIALGAKVERALARRMTGQDAVFKPKPANKPYSEKSPEVIRAN